MKQHYLPSEWKIWFSYLTEAQLNANQYSDQLQTIHGLSTVEDLAYIWHHSHVANLSNFFVSNHDGHLFCYKYSIH